jgi:hypothetical protein
MDKEKFTVDFPEDAEIQEHVRKIVSAGLPKKVSFVAHLIKMYKEIGLRFLFRDLTELVYILVIATSILLYLTLAAERFFMAGNENIITFIFISSPVLFLISCAVSFAKQKQANTYEIEMTCKYNVFQLAAFRMLVFSVFSLVLNALFIGAFVHFYQQIDFILAFMTSASSLLLYSVLYLASLLKIRTNTGRYGFIAVWIIFNLLMLQFSKEVYQMLLSKIPLSMYVVLIIIGVIIYVKSLKKLITIKNPEGVF